MLANDVFIFRLVNAINLVISDIGLSPVTCSSEYYSFQYEKLPVPGELDDEFRMGISA